MSRAREVVSAATLVEAVERGMNRRAMWLARGAESYARWGMQPSWTLVVEFTAARIEWEQLRLREWHELGGVAYLI